MLVTVTPAAAEPVTLDEAKAHLRVVHAAHDELIGALITSARQVVERHTGLALAEASYSWVPEGEDDEPLPLRPALRTSAPGERPVKFTSAPGVVPAALQSAIKLRVQAEYEGDAKSAEALTGAAERIEHLFRENMGV